MGEMYGYQKASKEKIFEFVNGRFQIWLDILEKPLKSKNLSFYFDGKCTFADLALFNIMDGVEELFGADSFDKYVVTTHSYLAKVYNQLKERESIKRLMKKQGICSLISAINAIQICTDGMYSFAPAFGWDACRAIFRSKDTALTFKSDEIIPDVVDTEPLELLKVTYGKLALNEMGQTLTPTQVQDVPNSFEFKACDATKLYTIILTDPDARDRKKHEFREWVHFVKINVNGSDLVNSGDALIEYVGSGPPKGSGLHRYVWLVYEQSNGKIDIDQCGQKKLISGGGKGEGRQSWKARKFVSNNKLGPLVAGTYYNAEYDEFVPKLYAWLAGKGSYKSVEE